MRSEILQKTDSKERSLLNLACLIVTQDGAIPPKRGTVEQLSAVGLIIDAGADPSQSDHIGRAPLHVAAISNHFDLAKMLLEAGALIDGKLMGAKGGSPLALAEFLVNPPVPYNLRTASALGHNIGTFFSGQELIAQASEQVDFYRPIPQFPEWERTNSRQELLDEALSWSARNNQVKAMSQLVNFGANVNSNPYRGTPLLWAIYK